MTANESAVDERGLEWLRGSGLIVALMALVKLLAHLYANRHYGYFVDELYYLACSEHLDWGYVDQPPLIAALTWLIRITLGDSLPAIRLLPAVAGAAKVLLAGLLAREFGGRRIAQGFAALAVLTAPGFLALDNWLSMNPLEPVFWMACALIVARMLRTGDDRLWVWFGLVAGLGLENKHSMLLFGFGLIAGLAATEYRRLFWSRWLLVGATIAMLVFLPNLLWNIQHNFPFLELQRNIRESGRNVPMGPLRFAGEEILSMLPLSAPIWLLGLWWLLKNARYRALGISWMVTAVLIAWLNPRVYYLFPAFPLAMAAGGVLLEEWATGRSWRVLRTGYAALMMLMAIVIAPTVLPVLPPETYIRYSKTIGIQQPRIETHRMGPLPQLFADQFGWEDMAAAVSGVYHSLPADLQARTAIFGQNYGQAGAIDHFGRKWGLPKAISGHQSYWLWGPRGYTGESMIVMGDSEERLKELFTTVRKAARVEHPYAMPYEHIDIFYCLGMKVPLAEMWPRIKNWR